MLHGIALRDMLEGRFEVKSNKDSGVVSFREVLDGLDHRVCSVWSSNTTLQGSRTLGHRFFLCCHYRFERKSAEKRHQEEWSVAACGFGKRCDLSSFQEL